ncbi:PaaI family thioesterase [Mycobacterium sp. ITM-2016-00318]|uniref:PaaI family thioesterase n=1 Tax=Mycobacterium sp. ITM-2016-00318 TaxID=2099693 RepID=UPI000CF8FAE0|nr:PaaI family thioesterase [Mycobacterium sp. ITM-2016-00318]WNG91848.1 PaaI family thioesterase [Mycobacterium sp. ITM-2016-00318]
MVALTTERLHMSPVHKRMQMNVDRVEPGLAIISMPLSEDVRGYFEGSVHGGMLATLADAASASCLASSYDFDTQFTVTTDIHVRYYRQPKGGPLVAEARLVHGGRRLLSTDCSVTDVEGRVLIRTTATFMLVPNPNPM